MSLQPVATYITTLSDGRTVWRNGHRSGTYRHALEIVRDGAPQIVTWHSTLALARTERDRPFRRTQQPRVLPVAELPYDSPAARAARAATQ